MRNFELTKDDSNLIKGVAVLFLLFHHLFYDFTVLEKYQISSLAGLENLNKFGIFSKICLCLFVFVSGYGLSKAYEKNNDMSKCYRRILSLYIQYWMVFICMSIVSIFIFYKYSITNNTLAVYFSETTSVIQAVIYLILDFLGVSSLLSTPTINPTWWWIPISVLIYVLVPMLYNYTKKYGIATVLVSSIIIKLTQIDMYSGVYLFPTLLLGMCVSQNNLIPAFFMDKKGIGSMVIVIILYLFRTNAPGIVFYDLLISIALVCIIQIYIKKIPLISNVLIRIGNLSLYFFLTHTLIKNWFTYKIYSLKYTVLIFLCLFLLSWIISEIFNYVYTFFSSRNKLKL